MSTTLWTGTILDVGATIRVRSLSTGRGPFDRYTLYLEDSQTSAAYLDVTAQDDTVTGWSGAVVPSRYGLGAQDLVRALAEVIASRRPLRLAPTDAKAREVLAGITGVTAADGTATATGRAPAQVEAVEAVEALAEDIQSMADDARLDYEEKGTLLVQAASEAYADAAGMARKVVRDLMASKPAGNEEDSSPRDRMLEAFQAAVAAKTAGLDDASLTRVLSRADSLVEKDAAQAREVTVPVLVSMGDIRRLADAYNEFTRGLRVEPRAWDAGFELLEREIRAVIPDDVERDVGLEPYRDEW